MLLLSHGSRRVSNSLCGFPGTSAAPSIFIGTTIIVEFFR
jgi:hypothetical protein